LESSNSILKTKKPQKEKSSIVTVQFKLLLTPEQKTLLQNSANEYIRCVNELVALLNTAAEIPKLSSSNVSALLPSAVKNEAINAAKSVINKFKRGTCESLPILKKPVISWNNQNFKISENSLSFPLMVSGKSTRILVSAVFSDYQISLLQNKLGSLRITKKGGKWIAQVAVEMPQAEPAGNSAMGVDLGLKIPAVAVTDKGNLKFVGNGRQNKYMKRKFRAKRKALGKAKKQKAINKLSNKEQRWMKDQDHKVSREIVNFAKANEVSEIRIEQLQNIRNTARTSRKNEKNLHTWSFYRLALFITYKATLYGIKVMLVDPKYTSQTCPACGNRNKANDRRYKCKCGFMSHRDRVGATNILNAPVISGKRKPA